MFTLFLRGIANLIGILLVFFGACMVYVGLEVRDNPSELMDDMDEDERLVLGSGKEARDFVSDVGYGVSFLIAAACLFIGLYALFWGLGLV